MVKALPVNSFVVIPAQAGIHGFQRRGWRSLAYCFNRYPVLNIHQTVSMQAPRNSSTMDRLVPTLTSAISKKLQRKPLIR